MRDVRISCILATKDWFFERLLSACGVLALASVLAPLLILFGVRYGVITAMQERLLNDPTILTITPLGSGSGFDLAFFERMKNHPHVDFVVPKTRHIAATIQLVHEQGDKFHLVRVSMEPTGPDDPFLQRYGLSAVMDANKNSDTGDAVILSASAAQKLGFYANLTDIKHTVIQGELGRQRRGGGMENTSWPFVVAAILPPEAEDRDVVFVLPSVLDDAENYRDHVAVPLRNLTGDPPIQDTERRYAGFRLVAASLDAVPILAQEFHAQGIDVVTKARDIAVVAELDTSLTLVFSLIALAAAVGCAAATASFILAAVRRKDKHLGMLRLLGFSGTAIMAFPLMQAWLTGLGGVIMAFLVYGFVATGINHLFANSLAGEAVCRIEVWHMLVAFALVFILSSASALQAAFRAARIEPSDVLREL